MSYTTGRAMMRGTFYEERDSRVYVYLVYFLLSTLKTKFDHGHEWVAQLTQHAFHKGN
jgi:hypothetical protein